MTDSVVLSNNEHAILAAGNTSDGSATGVCASFAAVFTPDAHWIGFGLSYTTPWIDPTPSGTSYQLSVTGGVYNATGKDVPTNGCAATQAIGSTGDQGTPGATNSPCI